MKSRVAAALFAPLAVALLAVPAAAQSKRVSVAVMDFDYGTVNNWWGQYDIGKGMADQVVDELVNDGTFRVIERKKLDTVLAEQDFARSDRADPSAAKLAKVGKVLGVKYIISGSITKFGGEEKNFGGGGSRRQVPRRRRGQEGEDRGHAHRAHDRRHHRRDPDLEQGRGRVHQGRRAQARRHRRRRRRRLQHELRATTSDSAIGEAQEKACADLVAKFVAKADRLEN